MVLEAEGGNSGSHCQYHGKEWARKVSGFAVAIVNGSEMQEHLWILVLLLGTCKHMRNMRSSRLWTIGLCVKAVKL